MTGEGKSCIAFELAKSMAGSDKKVLLIDADIRKSLQSSAPKGADPGLTHYLSGQAELKDLFFKVNINNMDFIPAGSFVHNPAELIENDKFNKLIEISRKIYDYIIIDAPSIGVVIDAAIVAKQCDGVVMVIEQGKISRRMIHQAVEQLQRTGTQILGAVLNKVDVKSSSYY